MRCVKPIKKKSKSTDKRCSVLAIVGDTQVGLWVVRSLARNCITVHTIVNSRHSQSAHSRYSSSAWTLDTHPSDDGFAVEIEKLARQLGVGSIMPVSEGFHNALINLRDKFEPEIHIFSPSREVFDKATDKDFMQSLCTEIDVPVAKGMRLDQLMVDGKGDALQFPLVMRTRQQNIKGGKAPWKAAYAKTKEELDKIYEQVKVFAENIIVQEYHPGVEDHVQILMHKGEAVMVGDYIGEHHMPLAGGVTVQRVSCHHEQLIQDGIKLLKAIKFEGIAATQFHYDPEKDKYIFLEINPRFCGGLPTVIMAGFEASFRLWQSHFEPEKLEKDKYRLGLRSRILGGDANWLLGMLREDELPPGQKHLGKFRSVGSFLWNSGPWTKDDSFMWRDPKPFFVDLKQMIKKLGAKSHDIIGNN